MTEPPQRKFFLCTGELVGEDKIYKFPQAHIIGELKLRSDQENGDPKQGRTVSELAVFADALPTTHVPPIRPQVRAYVSHARKVNCSLCERGPRWVINQSSFMALMAWYGVETLEVKE